MILLTKHSETALPHKWQYRLLPGIWAMACSISVVGLSLVLYVGQQHKNVSLAVALKTQSIELQSELRSGFE